MFQRFVAGFIPLCILLGAFALTPGCETTPGDEGMVCTPTIEVDPAPPSGIKGFEYEHTFGIDCDCNDAEWRVINGVIPEGLAIVDGVLSGIPTKSNIYNFTLLYESGCELVDNAQASFSIVITEPPACSNLTLVDSVPLSVIDIAYQVDLFREGAEGPEDGEGQATFEMVSGGLPDGIALDDPNAQLVGTPTETGTFDFRLRVTDECPEPSGGSQMDERDYTLVVGEGCDPIELIGRGALIGTATERYEYILAEGGLPPVRVVLVSGQLPTGLMLFDDPARLEGTPTDPDTYFFRLGFEDSCSPPQTIEREYEMFVVPPGR